jgi:hypothetical protein
MKAKEAKPTYRVSSVNLLLVFSISPILLELA